MMVHKISIEKIIKSMETHKPDYVKLNAYKRLFSGGIFICEEVRRNLIRKTTILQRIEDKLDLLLENQNKKDIGL